MTELETLERAKMYMEKLANGINPIDDTVIPDEDGYPRFLNSCK